jgi:hypothetical protein
MIVLPKASQGKPYFCLRYLPDYWFNPNASTVEQHADLWISLVLAVAANSFLINALAPRPNTIQQADLFEFDETRITIELGRKGAPRYATRFHAEDFTHDYQDIAIHF